MTTMSNVPIKCLSCGATGSVGRVTANLQCRCGSHDLDLWDGEQTKKTGAAWHEKYWDEDNNLHLPDHLNGSYDKGYEQGRSGGDNLHDLHGNPWGHAEAFELGHEHGKRDYDHVSKQGAARNDGGTGWGKPHPDQDANWSDYAGPTPSRNPLSGQHMDADANHTCPVCNGTGHDERASGGGYDETTCRNCHGTGKVTYASDSHGGTNDAHMPSGPPLGANDNGRVSKVVVPGTQGNQQVTSSQSDKIMAMASTIVANNTGLSTQEAFELARRAVTAFPEDRS